MRGLMDLGAPVHACRVGFPADICEAIGIRRQEWRRGTQECVRHLLFFALTVIPALAAVDGTVMNTTTGRPQANVIISLVQPGQGGMQTLGSTKTDAQGKFKIEKSAEGMQLLQAIHAGVPYNKMLQPGQPTSNVQIEVFDSTTDASAAKLSQHIVFLQPSSNQLEVNEVYFVKNDTNKTYNNAKAGDLQFYVPGHEAQDAAVRVTVNAPGGMPVQRPAESTGKAGVYKVNYPIKPGETQFTVAYMLPGTDKFTSKSLTKTDTRLVVPNSVTLDGDGITSMGPDPSGKANLYSTSGVEYTVNIKGTGSMASSSGDGSGDQQEEDTGQPQITTVKPRIYAQLPVVIALASAVLLLGFVLLYRSTRESAKGKSRR
jgi:hypothetical protein